MAKQDYLVTVVHPTGFHSGEKRLTLHDSPMAPNSATLPGSLKFVTGEGFGCSRDYACIVFKSSKGFVAMKEKDAAEFAIKAFMAEHACTVTKIRKAK